jgi:hypothetical protein
MLKEVSEVNLLSNGLLKDPEKRSMSLQAIRIVISREREVICCEILEVNER